MITEMQALWAMARSIWQVRDFAMTKREAWSRR